MTSPVRELYPQEDRPVALHIEGHLLIRMLSNMGDPGSPVFERHPVNG